MVLGRSRSEGLQRGTWKLLEVVAMFTILIVLLSHDRRRRSKLSNDTLYVQVIVCQFHLSNAVIIK